MANEEFSVSYSQIKKWRFCKQAHYYAYVKRIVPRRKALPLKRGSILHECFQAIAEGKDWRPIIKKARKQYKKLFKEEQEYYGDLPNELQRIMEGYEFTYRDDPLKYTLVEQEQTVPLVKGKVRLKLKADTLGEDKKGRFWLVEHKSHKKIPSDETRFWDLQTLIYAWSLQKILDIRIAGVLWDYVRTKPPTQPRVLKNGTISKQKKIDTDHKTYLQAILDAGLDPADYEDMLEMLKGRQYRFYRRVYMPLNRTALEPIIRDTRMSALEIQALQHTPTRSLGFFTCSKCEYGALCYAELRGLDTQYLLEHEYKPRDGEEVESDDGEEDEEEATG